MGKDKEEMQKNVKHLFGWFAGYENVKVEVYQQEDISVRLDRCSVRPDNRSLAKAMEKAGVTQLLMPPKKLTEWINGLFK